MMWMRRWPVIPSTRHSKVLSWQTFWVIGVSHVGTTSLVRFSPKSSLELLASGSTTEGFSPISAGNSATDRRRTDGLRRGDRRAPAVSSLVQPDRALGLSLAVGLGLSFDSPGIRLRFTGPANNTKTEEWRVSRRSLRNDINIATSAVVCCPARCPRGHFRTPSNVIKQPARGHK